jgi:hypothetical protein
VRFTKYYYGDRIKENEVEEASRMHGRAEKCIKSFGWKNEKKPLEKPRHM